MLNTRNFNDLMLNKRNKTFINSQKSATGKARAEVSMQNNPLRLSNFIQENCQSMSRREKLMRITGGSQIGQTKNLTSLNDYSKI